MSLAAMELLLKPRWENENGTDVDYSITPMMSSSRITRYSMPSTLTVLARVLGEESLVALLDLERTDFAIVLDLAVAYGDHCAGLRLGRRSVRDHDARGGLLCFFKTRNDYPVMQGSNVHTFFSLFLRSNTKTLPPPAS